MKNLFLLFAFFLPLSAWSQFGLHGTLVNKNPRENFTEEALIQNGFGLGIDYTFSLAQYRVEFYPQLNYSVLDTDNPIAESSDFERKLKDRSFDFYFNTNVYLFDLEGDCDCPVWSKEGNFLKKGFFLQVSPGLHYHDYTYSVEEIIVGEPRVTESNTLTYSAALGAGIDFGLSEYITVSPYFRARYHFPSEIEGYMAENDLGNGDLAVSYFQLSPGIRLGFQLTDEFSRNKKMRARRERKNIKRQTKRRR